MPRLVRTVCILLAAGLTVASCEMIPSGTAPQRTEKDSKSKASDADISEVVILPSAVLAGEASAQSHSALARARIAPAPYYQQDTNTERYQHLDENPVHLAAEQPVSTFSIDVDTGAYSNVRRFLNSGQLPPQDAVRVEEMINYFDYQYPAATNRSTPFSVSTELAPAPWNANAWLLRIGIKGFEVKADERPPANLVFLIDVSGSMETPVKLPLLKNAFRLLADQLSARDRVSMVVYAGSSGVVLEPTPGDQKTKIREAIDRALSGSGRFVRSAASGSRPVFQYRPQ